MLHKNVHGNHSTGSREEFNGFLPYMGKAILISFYLTGLRPIYVIFFDFLPISFQMKNNDDMRL